MKDQAKEIIDKNDKKPATLKANETKSKCRYENTGLCKKKSDCTDIHPRKTCQAHSKLGSCPSEALCDHRHPYGICYDWQRFGTCFNGDSCRNRHPFELGRPANSSDQAFLGHGQGGGEPRAGLQGAGAEQEHWGGEAGRWSPSQVRYHDQRMGRW